MTEVILTLVIITLVIDVRSYQSVRL